MDGFLSYSLNNGKKIRVAMEENGKLVVKTLSVIKIQDDMVFYTTSKSKKVPQAINKSAILSCSYARGDDGDTLGTK